MANTLTQINLANTFNDWVIVTDLIVNEVNAIGKGNYTKDTGLFTINSPGTGLQVSNNSLFTGNVQITGAILASNTSINGSLSVSGNTNLTGNVYITNPITYYPNNFTLNANTTTAQNSSIIINRGITGQNAILRWNESNTYFDLLNVNNSNYFRILTNEHLSSNSFFNSTVNVATSAAVYAANTFLQANDAVIYTFASSAYTKANNAVQTGFVTYTANGVNVVPSSNADTITITAAVSNGINILANSNTKTIDIGIRPTGVVAGTYGSNTSIPIVNVNALGLVTGISNTSITIPPSTIIIANTGQITANASTGNVALGLANTGVTAGTYGSNTAIPIITLDSTGRVLNANTVPVSGGGGGTSLVASGTMLEYQQTITANYTVSANVNALTAGPVTIANSVTVVVPSGSNWTIV
jgi:hypothetical protein